MGMTLKEQSVQLLKKTEQSIKNMVADSVNKNEYDGLEEVFPVLKSLTELINNVEKGEVGARRENKKSVSSYVTNKNGYPSFSRIGDFLNRTGWSKKDKREYNQRILFDYVELVIPRVLKLAEKKSPFVMSELIPTIKDADGSTLQDYKTYFVVSWLKYLSLIKHHGDIGYSLADKDSLEDTVKEAWKELLN